MARIYTQLNKDLGARIRTKREALHLSRETLAERINVTPHYLGEVERGSIGMSLPTYKRVCEILGVHDGFLLWGDRTCAHASAEEITNLLAGVSPEFYPYLLTTLRDQIALIEAVEKRHPK